MARAISVTNSEISVIFFIFGLILSIMILKIIMDMWVQVPLMEFILIIFLLIISLIFYFIAMAWTNYLITKYKLNPFIDRVTNPNYEIWLRFTKDRTFAPQIVMKGPLGQNKGLAHGEKADIINRGDFPITLLNGNRAVIKYDLLSHNVNLDHVVGWQLIKKKHGMLGYDAYAKAIEEDRTLFKLEEKQDEQR